MNRQTQTRDPQPEGSEEAEGLLQVKGLPSRVPVCLTEAPGSPILARNGSLSPPKAAQEGRVARCPSKLLHPALGLQESLLMGRGPACHPRPTGFYHGLWGMNASFTP